MLENEEEARQKIDRVADLGIPVDVTDSIRSLKPPCERHGVALQIYQAQVDLYLQLNQLQKAIMAQRKWINCRLRIHGEGFCDEQTGFGYERLGDWLVRDSDWQAAQNVYQKAIQALQISRGGSDDPYTRCAINKLISAQQHLITISSPTVSSVKCGLCGVRATKKCSRCSVAVYCNKDHQSSHWKVHKNICKPS